MTALSNRTACSLVPLVLAVAGYAVLTAAPPDAGAPPFAGAVAPSGDVAVRSGDDSGRADSPDA